MEIIESSLFQVNISWNENGTVTFKNQRFWYFQPHLSNGCLSDNVTSINPVLAVRKFYNVF